MLYIDPKVIPEFQTPFSSWDRSDWALYFIEKYGGIDGAHHKTWVMDQVARVLKGTPAIITRAEWQVSTGQPSQEYLDWVKNLRDGEDGPETYDYDEGIAP